MKPLLLLAVLSLPASALAADVCAPHAALLRLVWSLSYERTDGPSRQATLDKAECSGFLRDSGARDFDQPMGEPSGAEPRLRFWSETSPYELRVEPSNGRADVILIKRDGRYERVMAKIDRVDLAELASTRLDYTGDVADGEYPELRVARGSRKIVRAARVVLAPRPR